MKIKLVDRMWVVRIAVFCQAIFHIRNALEICFDGAKEPVEGPANVPPESPGPPLHKLARAAKMQIKFVDRMWAVDVAVFHQAIFLVCEALEFRCDAPSNLADPDPPARAFPLPILAEVVASTGGKRSTASLPRLKQDDKCDGDRKSFRHQHHRPVAVLRITSFNFSATPPFEMSAESCDIT